MKILSTEVKPLKKLSLAVKAGENGGPKDLLPEDTEFSFILGLATEGLSGLERMLDGKAVSDVLEVSVGIEEEHEFFGHLRLPLRDLMMGRESLDLELTILSVDTPSDTEVVHAMAEYQSCGCGCGCC